MAQGAVLERGQAQHEGDKRRQILDGARTVFLSAGFDGASMGEIARAAGVSKGTLYVYFENKEDLFEALIIQEKTSLAEALFTLDAGDPDVPGVLARLGTSFLTEMCRPEHVSVVRMVIGACEKFPRFGLAFSLRAFTRADMAQLRRQVTASGPTTGRTFAAAARLAVHQSVDDSTASVATARSTRTAKSRTSSPSASRSGDPKVIVTLPGRIPPLFGAMISRVPATWTGTTGAPARLATNAAPGLWCWGQPSGERPPSG